MLYEYKAKITEVYDGDTCTAVADLGFNISLEIKVRLYGIDTPEIRGTERESGLKSKARLEQLILGKTVIIETLKDKTEKYGRWLGKIFVWKEDLTERIYVNDILIIEGLAKPYMI